MEPAGLVQLGHLWAQLERPGGAAASAAVLQTLSEDVASMRIQESGVMVYEEDSSTPNLPEA